MEDFIHKLNQLAVDPEYVQQVSTFEGLTRIGELMADTGLYMQETRFALMWADYEAAHRFVDAVVPLQGGVGDFNGHLDEERNYNPDEQTATYESNLQKATPEQLACIAAVLTSVRGQSEQKQHLILAPAGTGKSFVFSTLLAAVRADGQVAIAMASSGIRCCCLAAVRRILCSRFPCH